MNGTRPKSVRARRDIVPSSPSTSVKMAPPAMYVWSNPAAFPRSTCLLRARCNVLTLLAHCRKVILVPICMWNYGLNHRGEVREALGQLAIGKRSFNHTRNKGAQRFDFQ